MKLVKIFIFLIVLLAVWMIAPAEAFVLGNTATPAVTSYSSAAGAQHQSNLYFQSEPLMGADRLFIPYMQTRSYNFSSMPRRFSSRAKYFSRGSRGYGRTSNYDSSADLNTTPTETPEPATLLLFGMGLAGAGVYRRLKN